MTLMTAALAAMWLAQEPTAVTSLRQEYVGVELAPLSLNAGSDQIGGAPHRFQPGFGGTVRVLRRSWADAYWTPLMVGLFMAHRDLPNEPVRSGEWTVLAHVQTEGGVRLPTRAGTLELGLAAGVGIISIPYKTDCDGSCLLGGKGILVSPVIHYLVRERPSSTIGVSLRAVLPVTEPNGQGFGYYTGRAALFLLALDLGLGNLELRR